MAANGNRPDRVQNVLTLLYAAKALGETRDETVIKLAKSAKELIDKIDTIAQENIKKDKQLADQAQQLAIAQAQLKAQDVQLTEAQNESSVLMSQLEKVSRYLGIYEDTRVEAVGKISDLLHGVGQLSESLGADRVGRLRFENGTWVECQD